MLAKLCACHRFCLCASHYICCPCQPCRCRPWLSVSCCLCRHTPALLVLLESRLCCALPGYVPSAHRLLLCCLLLPRPPPLPPPHQMCFFAHSESQLRPRTGIKTYSGGRRSGRRHRALSSAGASAGSDSGNNSPSMASFQAPTYLLLTPAGSDNAGSSDFSAHEALSRLSLGTMEHHGPQPDLLNSYVVSMPLSGMGLQQAVEVPSCMAFSTAQLSTTQISPTSSIGPGGIELLPMSCPTLGLGLVTGMTTQGLPASVTAGSHLDLQQGTQLFACTSGPAAPDNFFIVDPASSSAATWTPPASQFAPAAGGYDGGSLQVVRLPTPQGPQSHMNLLGPVEPGYLHAHTSGNTQMAMGGGASGSVQVIGPHPTAAGQQYNGGQQYNANQQYILVPVDGGSPVAAGMLAPQQLQLLPQGHLNLQLVSSGMSANVPGGSMGQQPTMVLVQSRQQH